jgi:hypothetical protein
MVWRPRFPIQNSSSYVSGTDHIRVRLLTADDVDRLLNREDTSLLSSSRAKLSLDSFGWSGSSNTFFWFLELCLRVTYTKK